MFTSTGDVVVALRRLRDHYDPRSTSLMALGGPSDPHAAPFHARFLDGFEERTELVARLRTLDERSCALLILWHVAGHPVAHIARMLGMSRMHCYRVERRALLSLLDEPHAQPASA